MKKVQRGLLLIGCCLPIVGASGQSPQKEPSACEHECREHTVLSALYDTNTNFTGTGFDPVTAGWTFVPEPTTGPMLGSGLLGFVWDMATVHSA